MDMDHSVNCYCCNELVDERECISADEYNGYNGGEICRDCQKTLPPLDELNDD